MRITPEPMAGVSDEVRIVFEDFGVTAAVGGERLRAALEAAAPLLVADAVAERDAEIERLRTEVDRERLFVRRAYRDVNQVLDDLMGPDWKGGEGGLASDVHEAIVYARAELAEEEREHAKSLSIMEAALDERDAARDEVLQLKSEIDWHAAHSEVVEEQLAGVVAAVEGMADRGVGTDLNPTRLVGNFESDSWWSDYLGRLDERWRAALRAALASTGAGEALARVRERAWDEGFGTGACCAEPWTPNPYAATEKGADDE